MNILHLTRNILFQYCSCNVQQYQNAHTVHRGLCCIYMYESRGARQVHSNTNQDNSFFKGKRSCPGWDSNPRHTTYKAECSALPTELPGQLSRQGSKSTTQHNTHYCTNISEVVVQRAMSEGVPQEIVESLLNKRWDYTPAT